MTEKEMLTSYPLAILHITVKTVLHYTNGGGRQPIDINNRADGYDIEYENIYKGKDVTEYFVYTSGNSVYYGKEYIKKGKAQYGWLKTISFRDLFELTKAYQRDQAIVQAHRQGDLVPEAVKVKFGKILALSAIAYNTKRNIAIEKNYWPNTYSEIIKLTKKHDWGKAYQMLSWSGQIDGHNQKKDAKQFRALYGAQLAANRSVKLAWKNTYCVYKRAILNGLPEKQAKRIAGLTYVSDIVLFDSFIASSDLSKLASSKISLLTGGEQNLSLTTYALMPFVIFRQANDSRHIDKLERINRRNPKIASGLLDYDLFKNKCLTQILHYGYDKYEQYLGFHPFHRFFRSVKHTIQKTYGALDKWVFDPLIGSAVRLSTFNQFTGERLQKKFNGIQGWGDALSFTFVKSVVHLPKHLYKDTKELSHQLGRVLTGQATWKGSWDALGRDTKGSRRILKFGFKNSLGGWIWDKANGKSDHVFQDWGKLFNTVGVGISAARHVGELKKDIAFAHIEIHLHHVLHQWSPQLFRSPYQLAESYYPRAFKKINLAEKAIENKIVQGLKEYLNRKLLEKLFLDMAMNKKPTLTSTQKSQLQADKANIQEKIKSYDPKKKISYYLFSNSNQLKKQFKLIHEREVKRLNRQVGFLRFSHQHSQVISLNLIRASDLSKEQHVIKNTIRNANLNISKQIQSDWNSGGEKLFHHIFLNPIIYTLPLKRNQSSAVATELKDIQTFYQTHKIGEKVFADILLGDLVSRLLHDTPIVTYAKRTSTRLNSTFFGSSFMRLVEWDTRPFISRMHFVFSVAQISVNETSVEEFTSTTKKRIQAMAQSSSFKTFVDNHNWAADDLKWYEYNKSKGDFKQSWKKHINADAQKSPNYNHGVAVSWQKNVKKIKSGQTLTVGQIINSLEPSGEIWGLTLPEPVAPITRSNATHQLSKNNSAQPSKNGSQMPLNNPVTVNLLGFYGHIKFAKHLYKKVFTKKADPAKDDAKSLKEDADTEVDTTIEDAENDVDTAIEDTELDVADAVEHTVEDEVETDIIDSEALVADAEIDSLA